MSELRYHPLIDDWIMIAASRQGRPQMPKDWCPFCPGSGKVPDQFDVLKYDNDFPALSQDAEEPSDALCGPLFRNAEAHGKCEVILYSPEHTVTLPELPVPHIRKLVDLWCDRFADISADPKVKYVFIFENRGAAVGVTMPHPHGQIYGYPWVPKKIELETENCAKYHAKNGRCLICDMRAEEEKAGDRVVIKNDSFTVVLPYFCEYPYGVYVVSNAHKQFITDLTDKERDDLAAILRETAGTLDSLFGFAFPYMMCMHQAPVNTDKDYSENYHFHIEFFPPMRAADKIKYNASSETGVWAHCNPTSPEEKAEELRAAHERFMKGE
ncbi:MAG: galactose-1-phosphate uridylyltransferase [Clostridia bacterium]|nr:galactose-1-phosphate uridylyltransferase [Clostridia bacterium]